MLILFADDSSNQFLAFVKIQDSPPEKRIVIIVASCTAAGFSLMTIFVCAVIWKRRKKDEGLLFDVILGTPKRFSFDELKVATSNFSMKLGHGGFGSVFKGRIGKETIAVKRLEGVEQGTEEFLAEVKTIGRMHHRNLVRLVGFCAEKSHKLLVYGYLSNGSLDRWIFHTSPVFTLSWRTRRNIIIAVARGMAFLHEECKEKIAHLDIKPQNILLDDEFNAKLSDFGLSKMINRDQSKVMTRMRGTRGYLAPEWLGSKITEKADIYSFGIVMIEIICGRQNLDESQPEGSVHLISLLQEKARSGQLSDLVDSSSNDMKSHMEEVMQTMKLAMWCLQVDSCARPLMSTVAKVLEGVKSLDATPDCTFVPNFASSNIGVAESRSSYVPSESHLSGPR
jgi:serine/threonine protein kinase